MTDGRTYTPDEIADLMTGMSADSAVQALRLQIDRSFTNSREKSLAMTKLDECELWLGALERKT